MLYLSPPFTHKSTQIEQLSCFNRTIILMVVPAMAGVWCLDGILQPVPGTCNLPRQLSQDAPGASLQLLVSIQQQKQTQAPLQ